MGTKLIGISGCLCSTLGFGEDSGTLLLLLEAVFFPLALPLGIHECPSMQWQLGLFVHTGKAVFDKYKTLSLSHFGIFSDFPKQMSWKIH